MLQLSKLIKSRDEWRAKGVARATEIRGYRKIVKQNKEKIAQLEEKVIELELKVEDSKKNS